MNTKKVNVVPIKLPVKSAFMIETDPDFPKLHTLMVCSGKRGSGKSVAIANFIAICKKKHYFDRVYLITPSYNSNKTIWDIADIEEQDVFEPEVDVLKRIIKKVEEEKSAWDAFIAKKELYKKFKKDIQTKNVDKINEDNLINYLDQGFFDNMINEKWIYPIEQPPRLCIILDDTINAPVMARRSSGLASISLKHRHIASGLGVSLIFLVQSYSCNDGLPRVLRENCTHLLLFKINNEQQLKKIKDESDLPITDEEFTEICKLAFSVEHNFLFIDFAHKCPTKQFRNGWNEYFVLKSLEGKCKCNK